MKAQDSKPCANCGIELKGPICHQCGQRQITQRWSTSILVQQFIRQLTNIEKGFWFTITKLFTAPGEVIHDYWRGKTVIYYDPFRYLLIWTAITLLISFGLGIDDLIQASLQPDVVEENFGATTVQAADQRFDKWMNILVLFLVPINSLMTHWLFKKKGQHYAEHLIMNAYIVGQQGIIGVFTQLFFFFFPALVSGFFVTSFLGGVLYNGFVYYRTFTPAWWVALGKGFLVALAGTLAFFILVFLFSTLALILS